MDEDAEKVRRGEMTLEEYVRKDMQERMQAAALKVAMEEEQEWLHGKSGLLASLRRGGVAGTVSGRLTHTTPTVHEVRFESNPGSYVPPELSYKVWDDEGNLVDPPQAPDFRALEMRVLGMDMASKPDITSLGKFEITGDMSTYFEVDPSSQAYKDAKAIRFGAMYGLDVRPPTPGSLTKLLYFERPSQAQIAKATAWWLRRMMLDAMLWKRARDRRLAREAKRKERQATLEARRDERSVAKMMKAKVWRKHKKAARWRHRGWAKGNRAIRTFERLHGKGSWMRTSQRTVIALRKETCFFG